MASKRQEHHFFSVFINYPYPGEPEMRYFGFSERQASWAFYRTIRAAERTPDARSVDLRQDGEPVASVSVKTVAAIA